MRELRKQLDAVDRQLSAFDVAEEEPEDKLAKQEFERQSPALGFFSGIFFEPLAFFVEGLPHGPQAFSDFRRYKVRQADSGLSTVQERKPRTHDVQSGSHVSSFRRIRHPCLRVCIAGIHEALEPIS